MKPRVVGRSAAHADAARDEGAARLVRNGVLVHRQAHAFEQLLGVLARDVGRGQIDQAQMVVGAAGHQAQAAVHHALAEHARVLHHLVDVRGERRGQRLAEGHGLAGDHVHERTALRTGEHGAVDLLVQLFVVGQDEAAARAAQRFVAGGGHDVGMRHGAGMRARGNQAGDVGHVHHEVRPHLVGDGGHALEIDDARIGARAADDHLGTAFLGLGLKGVVVNGLGFGIDAVRFHVVQATREVHRAAVRKVAALVQAHAQDGVARLDDGEVCGKVRVRAGMGLDVGEPAAEQLAGAVARQVLDDVDLLAAAVVALARVAFGVLVREHAAHGLHNGRRREVLRRDELHGIAFAGKLLTERVRNDGIGLGYVGKSHGIPFAGLFRGYASTTGVRKIQPS